MKTKNVFRAIALLAVASVGFMACGDDEKNAPPPSSSFDGRLSVKLNHGAAYDSFIDSVKVTFIILEQENEEETYEPVYITLASAPFVNGGFDLILPSTIPDKLLEPFSDDDDNQTTNDDRLIVSDPDALWCGFPFISAYDENGYETGQLEYGAQKSNNNTIKATITLFFYVDRDVILTGSSSRDDMGAKIYMQYDAQLKQGWNKLYMTETMSMTSQIITYRCTTKKPNGLTWLLSGGLDYEGELYESPAKISKAISKRKVFPFFK